MHSRLQLELPIVQAPMGGSMSTPALAAAVANAGGLGSIGIRPPGAMRRAFSEARALAPGRPLAMGLLIPFIRSTHVRLVIEARPEAVILMDGFAPKVVAQLHDAGLLVIHQIGSRSDAQRALRDGADALIAQGVEAGGHVVADEPVASVFPQVREVAGDTPVLLAGGIATADDVRAALARGAAAVVVGTRYLLTRESGAHPAYQQRILGAQRTLLTTLFGVGWTLKHRVVPNAATDRYCDAKGNIAPWVRWIQRTTEPLLQPFAMVERAGHSAARTRNVLPLFTPAALEQGQSAAGVEHTALYAGETAARIHSIESAFEITRQLGGRA